MSFSKYVTGLLGGAFEGATLGLVSSLDGLDDDRARALLSAGLKKAYESVELPAERKKRLLLLLAEAVSKLQQDVK